MGIPQFSVTHRNKSFFFFTLKVEYRFSLHVFFIWGLCWRSKDYLGCIFPRTRTMAGPCNSSETSVLGPDTLFLLIIHLAQPVTWPGLTSSLHGVHSSHRGSQSVAGTGRKDSDYFEWIKQSRTWDFHVTMHIAWTAGTRIPWLPGLPPTSMATLPQFPLLALPLPLTSL